MVRAKNPWLWALLYTLFVIVFGAVVRITGSGAGCGQHWPTCHGEVVHLPGSVETAIELTHRVTSGLSLLVVLGLTVWTFRRFQRGAFARRAAAWSLTFMVTESLVGAALVLLALVGNNDSGARAVVMGVHLVNTSALTFALLAAAWGWEGARTEPPGKVGRPQWWSRATLLPWVGVALLLLVSAAGAVTALGDTLYPVAPGTDSLAVTQRAGDTGAHFLERVRSFHPLTAIVAGIFLLAVAPRFDQPAVRVAVPWLVVIQLLLGLVNVWLSAPGWMQVLHLSIANLLWLAWCHGLLGQARVLPTAAFRFRVETTGWGAAKHGA